MLRWLAGKHSRFVGIEANTALVNDGDHCEVIGAGGVTDWDTGTKHRFLHGQRFTWSHPT